MPDLAAAMTLNPALEAMINHPGTLAQPHPNVADFIRSAIGSAVPRKQSAQCQPRGFVGESPSGDLRVSKQARYHVVYHRRGKLLRTLGYVLCILGSAARDPGMVVVTEPDAFRDRGMVGLKNGVEESGIRISEVLLR